MQAPDRNFIWHDDGHHRLFLRRTMLRIES